MPGALVEPSAPAAAGRKRRRKRTLFMIWTDPAMVLAVLAGVYFAWRARRRSTSVPGPPRTA